MFQVVYHVHEPTSRHRDHRDHRAVTPVSGAWVFALWLFGFLGLGGLHRFYLGRPRTGLVYLLTLSVFGLGLVWDWFRMPALVADAGRATPPRS
jgi:TM2 domain-containing membrane protein YozV